MGNQELVEPKTKKKYPEPVPKQDAPEQKKAKDDLVTSLASLTRAQNKYDEIKKKVVYHVIDTTNLGSAYKTGSAIAAVGTDVQEKLLEETVKSLRKENRDLTGLYEVHKDKKNQEVVNKAVTFS